MKKIYLDSQHCQVCHTSSKMAKNKKNFCRRFKNSVVKKINSWKNFEKLCTKVIVPGDYVCHNCYTNANRYESYLSDSVFLSNEKNSERTMPTKSFGSTLVINQETSAQYEGIADSLNDDLFLNDMALDADSESSDLEKENKLFLKIKRAYSSRKSCFICKASNERFKLTGLIPESRLQAYFDTEIFVPSHSICCHSHLTSAGYLRESAIGSLTEEKTGILTSSSEIINLLKTGLNQIIMLGRHIRLYF